jgi:hypothetical protein
MFAQAIQPEDGAPTPDRLESLNRVVFTPAQIEGALEMLFLLPTQRQRDPRLQVLALQAYARDSGLDDDVATAAALHARIAALAKWTVAHDPRRQSDAQAVMAAAAQFPLSKLGEGMGSESTGFQEMILFIEELPW